MNYSEMSDWQINYAVAEACGSAGRCDIHGWVLHKNKRFDPCNNPSDAWTIIVENKISLVSPTIEQAEKGIRRWAADNDSGAKYWVLHDNPLRAAMIVFLMMNEVDSEQ